jgi:hypothetical protein
VQIGNVDLQHDYSEGFSSRNKLQPWLVDSEEVLPRPGCGTGGYLLDGQSDWRSDSAMVVVTPLLGGNIVTDIAEGPTVCAVLSPRVY